MNKRLTAMVTVLNGLVVQSFSYNRYLPVGTPEIICENLSRWGADEIIVSLIDLSKKQLSPNLKLLERISKSNVSTPLIYSGGICNSQDAMDAINAGADRIVVDSILSNKNIDLINDISNKIGAQALIISMPVVEKDNKLFRYNYISKSFTEFEKIQQILSSINFSEILLIDRDNEGGENFNFKLVNMILEHSDYELLVFGGISNEKNIKKLIKFDKINSIVIGNSLNYKEIQISNLKSKFKKSFRKVYYE